MSFDFVQVNAFTPNSRVNWVSISTITSWSQSGNTLTLVMSTAGMSLQVSFLGPECFRVRFRPVVSPNYTIETSPAVVDRDLRLAPGALSVVDSGDHLMASTGSISVRIDKNPYRIRVYRHGSLISSDLPDFNLVYIPGQEVVANLKVVPQNARYCGFGSKAGAQLFKNDFTMTFFNFDNFSYINGPIPSGDAGPLNPTEPLYCSVPLLIEVNPSPTGDFSGAPYAYGIFFDNPSQSYFNITSSSDMSNKFYFGALYGEMDYYFMAGADCRDVLAQYTTLTGRAPMPPKYVFGFHQGAYGYYDHYTLAAVANSYRAARVPIDGLHIDVDFQDNYRTFTHSELKFPNARHYLEDLHAIGFKCSTNITPLLTSRELDENGEPAAYPELEAMKAAGGLIASLDPADPDPYFLGQVGYGKNFGSNPYPYPPLVPDSHGDTSLGAPGRYSDYSRASVRQAWGDQYKHLIQYLGMDMIWQDMTCPAIDTGNKTFPLALIQNPDGQGPVPHAKIHNVYALQLLNATWDGIQRLRKAVAQQRNFIIARGGFAGMQRYAGLWTGDSPSTWDYLSIYVPQVINLGLSGIPISGADIGGFATAPGTPDPQIVNGKVLGNVTPADLFTRWTHVGAFLPWFRNHYNGYAKQFQEVYAYGEPVLSNCRKYIELRYRMIQIFYDAMYEWTQTGMPICRPLFFANPSDVDSYNSVNDEFLVGDNILVAPILSPNPSRDVYLPRGSDWYSFKDNRTKLESPVQGGSRFSYYAPLDLVPIYIRAGAILPLRELEQYVGELHQRGKPNPLTFNVYPGPDSTYRLYQDDDITFDAEDSGIYRITEISHQGISGGQNIRIRRVYDKYTPPEPFYFVAFPGTRHPSSVSVGGAALMDVGTPENLASAPVNAYYWNAGIEVTFIKVFDKTADVTVTALFL